MVTTRNSPLTFCEQWISGLAATRAAFPALIGMTFTAFPCCSHPLPSNAQSLRVLGALDEKIELNRRMNATLEAMARALFQSWFVDFDPVRAKLDARSSPPLRRTHRAADGENQSQLH